MAGDLRKAWREVKKAHPTFEKSKGFKADLGPNLDKLEKSLKSAIENVRGLDKAVDEVLQNIAQCQAIMKAYVSVAKAMEDGHLEGALDDIEEEFDDIEKNWSGVKDMVDDIATTPL